MTTPGPVYNPDVPLRKDLISDSQEAFLNNFQTLYDAFAANHVPLDAASNAGNHTYIQLLEQATQFQTNVGEISVYSKNVPGQTDQIFLRYQGNQDEIQYTNFQIFTNPSTATQTFNFTFLPGKILVYFGTVIPNKVNFPLILIPPIAKEIITMNFCPLGNGSTAFYPPIVNTSSNTSGFIDEIYLTSSFMLGEVVPPCYYLVMANL